MSIQIQTPGVTREQALDIAEHAAEILKSRFGATRIIVFGSARGDAPWHEGSDLDLAVEGLPNASFWHIQLLMQMYQDIPGVRPAVLTDEVLYARLDDYRKFRHIVRMTYRIELDWDKLEPQILSMPDTFARFRSQLDEFFTALINEKQ